MNANSVYKIPDGKLVKISMEIENNSIKEIKIHGDFFLYPENGIEKIEQNLTGKELIETKLIETIDSSVKENKIEFFGLSSEGLAKAILIAKESVSNE